MISSVLFSVTISSVLFSVTFSSVLFSVMISSVLFSVMISSALFSVMVSSVLFSVMIGSVLFSVMISSVLFSVMISSVLFSVMISSVLFSVMISRVLFMSGVHFFQLKQHLNYCLKLSTVAHNNQKQSDGQEVMLFLQCHFCTSIRLFLMSVTSAFAFYDFYSKLSKQMPLSFKLLHCCLFVTVNSTSWHFLLGFF